MDGGSSSEVTKIEQVVTSAGDSWVICRSKSHSGRIYYFNTLTGEAAWNLSEAEIEKAKHRTKNLANHAGIDRCPEPKEPPMDNPKEVPELNRRRISEPATVYNKQIINNRFPNQQYQRSPIILPSYGVIPNPINSLLPIGINAQSTNFNSNVWTVPPAHQIYIAPSVSLYNEPEPSCHVGYRRHNITAANASTSQSEHFQHMRYKKFSSPHRHFERNYGQRKDNFVQRNLHKNSRNNLGTNDLRAFLKAKKRQRSLSQSETKDLEVVTHVKTDGDGQNNQKPAETSQCDSGENHNEKDEHVDADSDWLEDNILCQGGQLKLDVNNLKKLAKPDADPTCWYIAADKDILLNHLNFLNILCQSDEACHLMVPDKVESELHDVAREDSGRVGKRARRACTFLWQRQDAGCVDIGKGACDADNTRSQYLINCCNNISERNIHVILLSNENDLKSLKNASNIPIFTINEIKEFMTKPYKEHDVANVKSTEICPPIKITICNDLSKDVTTDTGSTDKANQETQPMAEVSLVDTCNEAKITEPENGSNVSDTGSSFKCIAEIGTQTDIPFSPVEPSDTTVSVVNFPKPDDESRYTQTVSGPEQSKDSMKSRRQIRLNRSVSNKISAASEDTTEQNKQFKWRKRRNALSTHIDDSELSAAKSCTHTHSSKTPEKNNDNTEVKNTNIETVQLLPHDRSNESISKRTNDDNADGSETSSIVNRNTTNDKIFIEETSTSGVISNTVSTVDSESESEKRYVLNRSFNETNETDTCKNVMFEVKDKKMEEYLKIKYDEWISRFIQIMEEVLTQILRQNKRFLCNVVYKMYGGGPWTVRDAAECIKIKFRYHTNIVEAANKLINIFIKISDDTGRITTILSPSKYMEMYSYGVNIVDALQSTIKDCEDLEIASQSLAKLLNDIQNPHLDSGHNDTFPDNIQESTGDVNDAPHPEEDVIHESVVPHSIEQSDENTKMYNLRSKSNKLPQSQDNSPVKLLQNKINKNADKQDSFFMSLNLKKKEFDIKNANVDKNLSLLSPIVTDNSKEAGKELENGICVEELRDKSTTSSSNVNTSNKNNTQREPLDLDELDYTAYHENDDDNSEKLSDISDSDEYYKNDYAKFDETVDEHDEMVVKFYNDGEEEIKKEQLNGKNINKTLNLLSNRIIKEVKEAMMDIHTFCVNTHRELCGSEVLNGRKIEILKETEEVQILIDKLCGSLTSEFNRETYTLENNIQSVLKQAGIIDSSLNCAQLSDYRAALITKCLIQAKMLQKSVALIFAVVKNKPVK